VTETAGLAPDLTAEDRIRLVAGAPVEGDWLGWLATAPLPVLAPERSYRQLLGKLDDWYRRRGIAFGGFLQGLAEWDRADERTRRSVLALLDDQLPKVAVARYEEAHRRLAVDVPEFAIWLQRSESQAIGRGLEELEATLRLITAGQDPDRLRAALAEAYRADLDRPILGDGSAGGLTVPRLGQGYVDSRFQVKAAGVNARPADEEWWDAETRSDLATFLARYLSTPQAAAAPMLLLGHPGAGKSALTRILAARLPASDFLAVRVVLREVPAEAEIQDQIEQALRSAIGRTVSWPDLAENAGDAMPVVMLDGFDELLQATGIHQSDYLQRVAEFQRREAVQKRPVAVIVTSRVAVADRARLPGDGLAVRLEAFDRRQVAEWLTTWNATNAEAFRTAGTAPLLPAVVQRFPDLAAQPLLLLMLALYDAADNALQQSDGSFGTTQLYERLLGEFAAREVSRLHRASPPSEVPGLVDEELMRLSIVAFAMFNRSRQWVTEAELDADLRRLRIEPSRPGRTEAFRSPLSAGQELVGRFFFIQRAQAVQDGKALQTYEFLHATFGEYLVARLVVLALQDAAARAAAGTLRLRSAEADDDLLQSLLGFLPLTTRNTILSFTAELLAAADRTTIRGWLVGRLRQALTRPDFGPRADRPDDQRADHWLATYSLNLTLLALACGEPLRASDLFPEEPDPAATLRGAGLVWRGSTAGKWIEVTEALTITRTWTDGRRDIVLTGDGGRDVQPVDPLWSHNLVSGLEPVGGLITRFRLDPALTSMQLTNNLSDDALRHALQPLIDRLPETLTHFVVQGPGDAESVGHSLVSLWLTSTLSDHPDELVRAYERAVRAVSAGGWDGETEMVHIASAISVVLKTMIRDADRLPLEMALEWLSTLIQSGYFGFLDNERQAVDLLRALPVGTELLPRYHFIRALLDVLPPASSQESANGR
jgi:hypothetical protein